MADNAQGTLAGAAGALIGAGLTALPTSQTTGLFLVGLGASLVVVRAYLRSEAGTPPE
jgi:hypothetical protein